VVAVEVDLVDEGHELDTGEVLAEVVDDGAELLRVDAAVAVGVEGAEVGLSSQ
jgi:hypothetical protein